MIRSREGSDIAPGKVFELRHHNQVPPCTSRTAAKLGLVPSAPRALKHSDGIIQARASLSEGSTRSMVTPVARPIIVATAGGVSTRMTFGPGRKG
jgi:hypothetical protein